MKPKTFVQVICLLAVAATLAVARVAPASGIDNLGTVVTLGIVALTAEFMGLLLPRGAGGSISFIPFMTAVALVPNTGALLAIVGARTIVELAQRRPAVKFSFNIGQVLLTYALAILVYRGLGGVSLFELRTLNLAQLTVAVGLPMMVSYVLTFALNTLLVSQVVALATHGKVFQVWKENSASTLGVDILASPIVFAFAWVYADFGPIIASLAWIPILGLRQLNTINLELAQTNRELLELMVKSIEIGRAHV